MTLRRMIAVPTIALSYLLMRLAAYALGPKQPLGRALAAHARLYHYVSSTF
jgi:hypothetical protein